MPKLWNETIETHRRDVRGAILDTTAALIADHGLRSVTMSRIADATGIGRATLYRYFPGIEAILLAWHERQVDAHLRHLSGVGKEGGQPGERLRAVLEAYAVLAHQTRVHHDDELAAFVHRDEQVVRARERLRRMVRDLIAEAAESGDVRADVAPEELAGYCIHALGAAGAMRSAAAVRRLVGVTLAGLRPPG